MKWEFESFDLDRIKRDFNVSDDAIKACGFSASELHEIYDDYVHNIPELEQYKTDFLSQYIMTAKGVHLHSYSGRVKHPDHLLEKIIRKRNNKDKKYATMQTTDYHKYITDLIGCRILIVYKSEWRQIHEYLVSKFKNCAEMYINCSDYAGSYCDSVDTCYMAEKPVIYTRPGDDDAIYSGVNDVDINNKGYYRSVHYIIRFKKYYIEIQVRSLFEEAWGEVDHDILYPLYKGNKKLVHFSRILNRAAGLGDEMSAYFKEYAGQGAFEKSGSMFDTPNSTSVIQAALPMDINKPNLDKDTDSPSHWNTATPADTIDIILND